ncbi:MAG: precorrin-3B C(17)-methyltransferase, partial [Desulfobacterales bacterium]|nr:precorrin-3B C(17)-methyltransferase [Desulfobacterales bacterium]
IYAMAGLAFEMCKLKNIPIVSPNADPGDDPDDSPLQVEVAPGIPALCSGAALLGAPLTHDFAAISLSNLLTPWELIEKRLEAAAAADFVIVLYNPKSKRRTEQLEKAQKIVLRHRSGETPVGVVTSVSRNGQQVRIVPLKDLHTAPVNMLTTVFIGSSASTQYRDFMVTPRGYSRKYKI